VNPHPYLTLPARSFWRPAVAEPAPSSIEDLWTPKFGLDPQDPIVTAGSCFAARIGSELRQRGMTWFDAEPAPADLSPGQRLERHYGEFSFRTGTIYTPALLLQWVSWALQRSTPPVGAWREEDRWYDAYRPSVEPEGHTSLQEMLDARAVTLSAIRTAVSSASCLIFTLGLTEAWRDRADGTVLPTCPGTVRGAFDRDRHEFHNYTFTELQGDLGEAITLMRSVNPALRVLITVSPQPLTATATGGHALVANTYTKSVLRAVAGELALADALVDYFPSYELITGIPFKSAFYAPNLRSVTDEGVAFVMSHFMRAYQIGAPGAHAQAVGPTDPPRQFSGGDVCDDAVLDYYAAR
jgi:hypothetical protein